MANDVTTKVDYVKEARDVILDIKKSNNGNILVTTSQIRKILSAANSIKNKLLALEANGKIEDDRLPQKIINDCLSLKVQLIYQCAREKTVHEFVKTTKLMEKFDAVGNSVDKLKKYFHYLEALVAYHKFEGGRD